MTRYPVLITVDVEDWFQVENLRPVFPVESWSSCELRVHKNTRVLLDLFERRAVRATFFVLGSIAERLPGLVVEIVEKGHEVASHGYGHELCSGLTGSLLLEDLQRSKSLLEEITGRAVAGYRAPSFSITPGLIEALGELGYAYDSSYNNFAMNTRYGRADDSLMLSRDGRLAFRNGVIELPVTNLSFFGRIIPWGGGGYFRLYPPFMFVAGVARILKQQGYYNFYCHPWEIDPSQPRAAGIGPLSRFRHYLNLDKALSRLDRFLERFGGCNFMSCSQYMNLHRA